MPKVSRNGAVRRKRSATEHPPGFTAESVPDPRQIPPRILGKVHPGFSAESAPEGKDARSKKAPARDLLQALYDRRVLEFRYSSSSGST